MGEERKEKIANITRWVVKNAWLFSICFAFLAIVFLFLPILNYEIREILTDNATGDKISKIDYVYNMTLVDYFSTGFKLNYTMYITIGFIVVGIVLAGLSKLKKDLLTISGISFLLAACMFILSKEFFRADENAVMDYAKIVTEYNQTTQSLSVSLCPGIC